MKRLIFLLLLSFLLIFVGCDTPDAPSSGSESSTEEQSSSSSTEEVPSYDFTIEYKAEEGGRISGESIQYINAGEECSVVRAIAEYGYRFIGWDDGSTSLRREDKPTESKVYTAKFIKLHMVSFKCDSNQGSIKGNASQGIMPGQSTTKVSAIPKAGFKFICWDNGSSESEIQITPSESTTITAIFAPESLVIPVVSIKTEGGAGVYSKEDYVNCFADISNAPEGYNFDLRGARIRCRGNTSYDVEKKSYKLKFDEKTNLFGYGAAKDWCLIANHFDLSIIRNYIAYTVAGAFETQSVASKGQLVDLYINDRYYGVYLLCEQIEVKEHRIEIETTTDVDTGYLIEIDTRADTVGTYIFAKYHSIKSPDVDNGELSQEQMQFIIQFLNKAYNTALNKTYAEVCELIDVKSFAEAYIVYELFKCVDVGYASFHMYKDAGGKLTCGPVWDFDRSMGNVRNNEAARRHDSLWARKDNIWFAALFIHDEFEALVCETLKEYLPKIQATLEGCYAYIDACVPSIKRNFERWDIIGEWIWPNPDELIEMQTWEEHYEFVKSYIEKSLAFMCEQYPSE